jgi:phage FluMu gp28-like protein
MLFNEAAFTDDIEEIYKSTISTTAMSGDKARIILLSTPNGQREFYVVQGSLTYWGLIAT